MLPDRYRVIKYGSLDDLYKALARCHYVIKRHETSDPRGHLKGYARVAKEWIDVFTAEIEKRRAAGEITIAEELQKITGNDFVICERR